MDSYFRTGIFDDALNTLDFASSQVISVRGNTALIKWAIISMHAALQGFMALALNRGNGLLVMPDREAKAWLQAHQSGLSQAVLPKMNSFLNLYKKVKCAESMKGFVGAEPFVSDASLDGRIKKLNEFRNRFIHFDIDGWSMETSGLHEILLAATDLIEFLQASILFPWHQSDQADKDRGRVEESIRAIRLACRSPFIIDAGGAN